MVNYLTTLFLGKPPDGSLTVFSAHFSPVIDNLFFLNHRKTEVFFSRKNVSNVRVDLGTVDCESDILPTELQWPVHHI